MLYHLSKINHDKEVFEPQIPSSPYTDECGEIIEDIVHPRVCFSQHISGAVLSLNTHDSDIVNEEYYVHIPKDIESWYGGDWFEHVYSPTRRQVPDSLFTYERWVTHPVEMKCIGKIKVNANIKEHLKSTYREHWRPNVRIKWIEKYN